MPDVFSPEAEAEALEIRGQLAQYRLDMLEEGRRLISDFAKDEESRLREIIEPLYALAPQEYRESFEKLLARERTIRLQRLQDSREYKVLSALDNLIESYGGVEAMTKLEMSCIPVDPITAKYNELYPSKKGDTSSPSISRTLIHLKFDTDRPYNKVTKKTERSIILDWELLGNLNSEYGLSNGP
jgi:hypothetical protein